jgi:hypothetical protein
MSRRFSILLALSLVLSFAQGQDAGGTGQTPPPPDVPTKSAPGSEKKQTGTKPSEKLEAAGKGKKHPKKPPANVSEAGKASDDKKEDKKADSKADNKEQNKEEPPK